MTVRPVLKCGLAIATCVGVAYFAFRIDKWSPWKSDPLHHECDRLHDELQSLKVDLVLRLNRITESVRQVDEAINTANADVERLTTQLRTAQRAVDGQQQRLDLYKAFLSNDEGAVLADGSYVSVRDIREQADFDARHLQHCKQVVASLGDQIKVASTLQKTAELRRDRMAQSKSELEEAVRQIDDQLRQVKVMKQTGLDGGVFAADSGENLNRLQLSIHRIQDQIDAHSGTLPEVEFAKNNIDSPTGKAER